jgi:Xaa-Pro aminopeptidase
VPSSDPHLSEYLPEHWRSRAWLSGFTGSAGTLLVAKDFAGLWTDSRYWVQAEKELAGTGIVLMKAAAGSNPPYQGWLIDNLDAGQTVGVDGEVLSLVTGQKLRQTLAGYQIRLHSDCNLVGDIWKDRPPLPAAPIYEHDIRFATVSRSEKLLGLRNRMRDLGAAWHFISTLDDVAYLFNLRGSDVEFNPVFVAHALVGPESAKLFVANGKIPQELQTRLLMDGIELMPYECAPAALAELPSSSGLLIDPRRVTIGMRQAIAEKVNVIEAINPTTIAKSQKTEKQIAHIRAVMEKDGAMLCEVFAWLDQSLEERETIPVTEVMVGEKILELRNKISDCVSPSFETMAGFNANGSLPHYSATAQAHAILKGSGLLLIDTGGQYQGGTTDISRTIPIGKPTPEQKRDFTLVLRGMIALSSAHFPRSIRSPMLDAIARAPLWAQGVEYGHGTGHGVGYFLNVHEGPQTISCYAASEAYTAMEEGMITSIEPGIYRTGKWGVRIENLVLSTSAEITEFGDFLRFETLTLCPIDTRCVDRELLSPHEISWLNDYHAEVRKRLLPHVQGAAKEWLMTRTQSL